MGDTVDSGKSRELVAVGGTAGSSDTAGSSGAASKCSISAVGTSTKLDPSAAHIQPRNIPNDFPPLVLDGEAVPQHRNFSGKAGKRRPHASIERARRRSIFQNTRIFDSSGQPTTRTERP